MSDAVAITIGQLSQDQAAAVYAANAPTGSNPFVTDAAMDTAVAAAVAAETGLRTAADVAEATARLTGLATEHAARIAADDALEATLAALVLASGSPLAEIVAARTAPHGTYPTLDERLDELLPSIGGTMSGMLTLQRTGTAGTYVRLDPLYVPSRNFNINLGQAANDGDPSRDNVVLNIGYNNSAGGVEDATEPSMTIQMESYYRPGGSDGLLEYILSVTPAAGASWSSFRPDMYVVNRETGYTSHERKADLHAWNTRTGVQLFGATGSGFAVYQPTTLNVSTQINGPLYLRDENGAGAALLLADAAGNLLVDGPGGTAEINFSEWRRARFWGYLQVEGITEPDNAELLTSQVALWWDDDEGKLKFKGRKNDNSLVTGSVTLS